NCPCNPDGDSYDNLTEFNNYSYQQDSTFDPLKNPNPRPIVSISPGQFFCDHAVFTISRDYAADVSQDLWVYYAVGGTLNYLTDYNLDPNPHTMPGDPDDPDGYPRIFLAKIPAAQPGVTDGRSVTVTASLTPQPVSACGTQALVVALTPYSVSLKT